MDLEKRVRDRLRYDAEKHDLNGDQDIDDYLDAKINRMSNTELLFAISLELEVEGVSG